MEEKKKKSDKEKKKLKIGSPPRCREVDRLFFLQLYSTTVNNLPCFL